MVSQRDEKRDVILRYRERSYIGIHLVTFKLVASDKTSFERECAQKEIQIKDSEFTNKKKKDSSKQMRNITVEFIFILNKHGRIEK